MRIKVIVLKELARVFGDRKLIFSLFILPAILMIGIYSLIGKMMTNAKNDVEQHVPGVYIQNAPEGFSDFVEKAGYKGDIIYFNGNNYLKKSAEEGAGSGTVKDIKNSILNGTADLMISFENGFADKIKNYKEGDAIPEIKTYYNPTEDYSSQARQTFVSTVLDIYQKQLLAARVGNLENLIIFNVDVDPTTSVIQNKDKANGKFLAMMMPYLVVLCLFSGPMSLGIDAITGEKERGTMASILITPVKRSEIVLGKIISLSLLSCMSALVYVVSIVIAVPAMYKGSGEETGIGAGAAGAAGAGAGASLSPVQIMELISIMLLLVYLYVAIVCLISAVARTAKEAGTYISPIYIVVMVTGMLTMFSGNKGISLPLYAIPVYGNAAVIQNIITNELTASQYGLCILGTIMAAGVLTYLITKAFNSEKVMFNA